MFTAINQVVVSERDKVSASLDLRSAWASSNRKLLGDIPEISLGRDTSAAGASFLYKKAPINLTAEDLEALKAKDDQLKKEFHERNGSL
jgi:hypothetical protein